MTKNTPEENDLSSFTEEELAVGALSVSTNLLKGAVQTTSLQALQHKLDPRSIKPADCDIAKEMALAGTEAISGIEMAATVLARKDIARISEQEAEGMKQSARNVGADLEKLSAPIMQTCKKFEI